VCVCVCVGVGLDTLSTIKNIKETAAAAAAFKYDQTNQVSNTHTPTQED